MGSVTEGSWCTHLYEMKYVPRNRLSSSYVCIWNPASDSIAQQSAPLISPPNHFRIYEDYQIS